MAETAPQTANPVGAIVTVTEAAANKVREAMNGTENKGIRIGVVGGGCAGLQYDLKAEEKPAEGDMILEFHGVSFYVNPMVVPYIKGSTIDYSSSLMEGGFKFINPNATSACGCGTSFGV